MTSCLLLAACASSFAEDKPKTPEYRDGKYHTRGVKSAKGGILPQHSPLGFLGASGLFEAERDDIRVLFVHRGGIAGKGGLRVGDIIVGANGKRFEKATINVDDGGRGPREGLGMAMDRSLSAPGKALTLKVKRRDGTRDLRLSLGDRIPFTRTYPADCPRSDAMIERLCKKAVTWQKPNGSFGGKAVQTATMGLGLLASGEEEHMGVIRKAAYHLVEKDLAKERFPTWAHIFSATFLAEYYLATGDKKVFEKLKHISDKLALEGTSKDGRHSHALRQKAGYGGGGLNIISGHVLLVWGLARKCGISIHETQYNATLKHLTKCTTIMGGTGYRQPIGMDDAAARTGLFTLALYIGGRDNDLQVIQGDYLARHTRRMRECHTNALFGMIWGSAALAAVNPDGYRTHMDHWRWYMNLGETPTGHELARYYIGGKKNNGGDGYLGFDLNNHASMILFLSVPRKVLYIHGNPKNGCAAPVRPPKNATPPAIRVAYYTPADREPIPGYVERLGRVMVNVREFYRNGMRAAGLGPMSFALERDKRKRLVVHVVRGQKGKSGGDQHGIGSAVKQHLKTKGIDPNKETIVIFSNLLEWKDGKAREAGPFIGKGNGTRGMAFVFDDKLLDPRRLGSREPGGYYGKPCSIGVFNSRYIGGVARNLGFAFGLPPVSQTKAELVRRGTSLMGRESVRYGRELRGEGKGVFLSGMSANLLAQTRGFSTRLRGRTGARVEIKTTEAEFVGGKLVITGLVQAHPPAAAILGYDESLEKQGGSFAKGWVAKVNGKGEFRMTVSELRPGRSKIKFLVTQMYVPGGRNMGRVEFAVNDKGVPDTTTITRDQFR
jgi:hypothetical protein